MHEHGAFRTVCTASRLSYLVPRQFRPLEIYLRESEKGCVKEFQQGHIGFLTDVNSKLDHTTQDAFLADVTDPLLEGRGGL